MVPSITAHTHDDYPGAEPIDLVLSSLLAQGFALLAGFGPMELVELPVLVGWSARLDSTGQLLELGKPDEVLYDGNLGPAVPMGWHRAAWSGCTQWVFLGVLGQHHRLVDLVDEQPAVPVRRREPERLPLPLDDRHRVPRLRRRECDTRRGKPAPSAR